MMICQNDALMTADDGEQNIHYVGAVSSRTAAVAAERRLPDILAASG